MSASHDTGSNSGQAQTAQAPQSVTGLVVGGTVAAVVAALVLAKVMAPGAPKMAANDDDAIAERIAPVARVVLKAAAPGGGAPKTGEQAYQAQCSACHATGAAGAPKLADAAAWAPRVKTGFESLLTSALKGKGGMPPQGGGALSDFEVARAVVHIANQGGAKFDEPKAPAAPASAAGK